MAHAMTHETDEPGPEIDWNASIGAGLLAGVMFMIVEMLFAALVHDQSPGYPSRLLAAVLMGREVLNPTDTFDLTVFAIASLMHFAKSLIVGALISWTVHGFDVALSVAFGAMVGLALYIVAYWGFTAAFPWLAQLRNWDTILNYTVFGGVTAWLYYRFRTRRNPHIASTN